MEEFEQIQPEVSEDTLNIGSNETINETVSLSPEEERASADGWVPEDKWEGSPDKWVDARTFNLRGELITKIKSQSKELDAVKKDMQGLRQHYARVAKAEVEAQISALKAQKAEAYRNEEFDAVADIDDAISDLKHKKAQVESSEEYSNTGNTPSQDDVAVFTKWVEKNDSWFKKDQEMTMDSSMWGNQYKLHNPEATVEDVLKYIDSKMRRAYPEKFTNPNRNKPAGVESGGGTTSSKSNGTGNGKYTINSLSPEQQQVARRYEKMGVMTVNEYINDLVKIGELK